MEPITITVGIPGESDVVLAELESAAAHFGLELDQAVVYLLGLGLAVLQVNDVLERATEPGRGFDPTPLRNEYCGRCGALRRDLRPGGMFFKACSLGRGGDHVWVSNESI